MKKELRAAHAALRRYSLNPHEDDTVARLAEALRALSQAVAHDNARSRVLRIQGERRDERKAETKAALEALQ